jgi:hypothetical protein
MHGLSTRLLATFWLFFLAMAVSAARAQSFSVTASQTLTIHPGDQNVPLPVSVSNSSYAGPISITLTGLPSGITVSPLSLPAGGTGTLELSATVAADQEAILPYYSDVTNFPNTVTVVAVAGALRASSTVTLTVSISNPSFAPAANEINLPIVTINTSGTPINSKTIDVPGTITVTSPDDQTSYLPNANDSDNTATFHVHGNTTAEMPKLAYHVKLNTSVDLLNVMGLNCPNVSSKGKPVCDKSKSYVLLANYDDKTFLRDWAASALANAIPFGNGYLNSSSGSPTPSGTSNLIPWAPHSLFVELYLNGIYEGNYQLIEEVKVDNNRLNITEMSETDTTGDDVTGGYLLEIDQENNEDYMFTTPQGVRIGLVDPDFSPEVPQQTAYVTNYVNTAENALFSSNFTDPTSGWRAYFDEATAVNFYIVNDLMGNADGGQFYSSDYLYKDISNPLLYMGPVWDFDISSGNTKDYGILNPTALWMQFKAPWYKQWFQDPGFKADVVTQWNALKNNGVFAAWLNSINQEAATLQQSQANNFGRWPMQGIMVPPNAEAAGSYSGEVSYMTTYINLRMAYLDSVFNAKSQTATTMTVSTSTIRAGSPVTLSAQVTGGNTPTGTVTFLLMNGVAGPTATLDNGGNAVVTSSNLPVGKYNVYAVYGGDKQNGLSTSSTTAINVLPPLIETSTSIASSAAAGQVGDSITFTAAVTGTAGTTPPTGSFTFTANGIPLGAANISGGSTTTFATMSLPAGSIPVQAVYSGDQNYQASPSPEILEAITGVPIVTAVSPANGPTKGGTSVAITGQNFAGATAVAFGGVPASSFTVVSSTSITAVSPSQSSGGTVDVVITTGGGTSAATSADEFTFLPGTFVLNATPSSATVMLGAAATFNLTVTPQNGFSGPVTFSCSGLPTGSSCAFAPSTVTPSSGPAASMLTISTMPTPNAAATSLGGNRSRSSTWLPFGGGIVLALLVWPVRRRRILPWMVLMLVIAAGISISGCGGGIRQQSYSVTVTATGGNVSQITMLHLVVTK